MDEYCPICDEETEHRRGKHLDFEELLLIKGEKLHRYRVHNHTLYDTIGEIHWRGGWRQYVFRAYPDVDMTRSCHKQIDKFIDILMNKWRKKC
jgi:predicted heme/steroid binding protein